MLTYVHWHQIQSFLYAKHVLCPLIEPPPSLWNQLPIVNWFHLAIEDLELSLDSWIIIIELTEASPSIYSYISKSITLDFLVLKSPENDWKCLQGFRKIHIIWKIQSLIPQRTSSLLSPPHSQLFLGTGTENQHYWWVCSALFIYSGISEVKIKNFIGHRHLVKHSGDQAQRFQKDWVWAPAPHKRWSRSTGIFQSLSVSASSLSFSLS